MKRVNLLLFIFLFALLTGCAMPKLSYFEVDPYAKPFDKGITVPIHVVLMDEVKDSVIVEGEGIKKMTVTEFRSSFSESIKKTLDANFEVINITDAKPQEGLSLVIYRVRPFWKINSQSYSSFGSDGNTYSTVNALVSAAFQFESSLFLNDEKIGSADMIVFSDDQLSTVQQAHPVFKNGLIKTCETINKEIFKDEIVARINDYPHSR